MDVLPPVPKDVYRETRPLEPNAVPFEGYKTFYHPASGVAILGLDWLAFGTDFLTGFLALPEMCVLSFFASFALVLSIQVKWSKDNLPMADRQSLSWRISGRHFPHRSLARSSARQSSRYPGCHIIRWKRSDGWLQVVRRNRHFRLVPKLYFGNAIVSAISLLSPRKIASGIGKWSCLIKFVPK